MIHQWCEHTVLAPDLSFSKPFVVCCHISTGNVHNALPGQTVSVNGSLPCCYCLSPLVWRGVVSHRCSRVCPCPISLRRSRNTPCQNIQTQPKQLDFWARVRRFALTTSTSRSLPWICSSHCTTFTERGRRAGNHFSRGGKQDGNRNGGEMWEDGLLLFLPRMGARK